MKMRDISIILAIFGVVILLSSFFDFYNLLFPVNIKSSEWVFAVSQKVADLLLIPVFAVLAFLIGINFSNFRRNKLVLNISRITAGLICVLFFIAVSADAIMFGLSMKPVQNKKIEALKTEGKKVKTQIDAVYNQNKAVITKEKYNETLKRFNDDLMLKINYIKFSHTQVNIKTLITLLLYTILYLFAAVKILSLETLLQRKCRLARR